MDPDRQRAIERAQIEQVCEAAMRALARRADLRWRGTTLHQGRQRLPAFPVHVQTGLEQGDRPGLRGAADGMAVRLRGSDADLHRRLAPSAGIALTLFDLLEQFRVESLVDDALPGVRRNLAQRFHDWSQDYHRTGLNETLRGLLLFTVAQSCRARVLGEPVDEAFEDLMESMRARLSARVGPDLAALRRARHDQARYAGHALSVIAGVEALLAALHDGRADDAPASARATRFDEARRAVGFTVIGEAGDAATGDAPTDGRPPALAPAAPYRIFTTAHDQVRHPAGRLRGELLREYRERLDPTVRAIGVEPARLARELIAALAVARDDDRAWDQEDGRVDGRRLARLITSPGERRLFQREQTTARPEVVVGLLFDCSGSMRRHAAALASIADLFSHALDLAEVPHEVLGFSTAAWNGGRALADWRRAGRPAQPGRLNEIAHLVFKDADTPWRRARLAIASLLHEASYREGVDGEAVAWAAARLARHREARRLLLVFSDGCPMDAATRQANPPGYLENHLIEVIDDLADAGAVAVGGVGVGLALGELYRDRIDVDLDGGARRPAIGSIVSLLAQLSRR